MKNRLKYEHKRIIEYLYLNAHQYISSSEIANELGLSAPTIIRLINELNDELDTFGAYLEARPGFGHRLRVSNQKQFSKLIYSSFYMDNIRLSDTQDAVHFVVREFLSKKYIKSTEFESSLFLARRSIFNLYKEVSKEIEIFDLELISASTNGNSIEGTEHNIRSCINYEITYFQNTNIGIEEKFGNLYVNRDKTREIERVIIHNQLAYNANSLDDSSIRNLANALHIAHVRNQMGCNLEYDDEVVDRFIRRDSYYMAKSVVDSLRNDLKLMLTDAESLFTAIFFVANRCFVSRDDFPTSEGYLDCMNLSIELVNYLGELNSFRYIDKDSQLIESLSLNLTQIVTQSEFNLYKANDIFKSSKSLQATLMAVQCAQFILNRYKFRLTPSQIDYLATVIYPVFGRYPFENQRGKAIIVSKENKFVARGIAERLERNFGNLIESFHLMNLYELENIVLEEYAFVFTSYSPYQLPVIPKETRVIHIDTFFNVEEKLEIRNRLIDRNMNTPLNYLDIINDATIHVNCEAVCRDEVYDLIASKNYPNLKAEFEAYEQFMNFPIHRNVVFITPLRASGESPSVQVYHMNKTINWGSGKIKTVIYWERGNSQTYANFFENESMPQVVYQLFSRNEIIELLNKNDSAVNDLIKRLSRQISEVIIETGASFR